MGCVGPSHVPLWEAHHIRILARNWQPTVPRVMTLTVARELSIERVAGTDHSTVGRIGYHVVL
jgi:hypothetical protein